MANIQKNLLLLSYYFPPGNIIGAVRPFQIAQFFRAQGWNVYVVSCKDASVPDDYFADASTLVVRRIRAPMLLEWLSAPYVAPKGWLARVGGFVSRGLKFVIRSLCFPDPFVLVRKPIGDEAEQFARDVRFDLLISSAFPFTIHTVARRIAKHYRIPWVADNRDLWASSPYRRMIIPRRKFDCLYERAVLRDAQLVTGISQGMVDYYKKAYEFNNTLCVMNGYSLNAVVSCSSPRNPSHDLEIVYGGGLYGGVRDPSPLLDAVAGDESLISKVRIRFVGSEPDVVERLSHKFPQCSIERLPRVTKAEIANKYLDSSVLLVILGSGRFENGVMTGKFFEYLAYGRPILTIAAEDTELAQLVNSTGVGLATNSPERIRSYLKSLISGDTRCSIVPPKSLSIEFQLSLLFDAVKVVLEEYSQ